MLFKKNNSKINKKMLEDENDNIFLEDDNKDKSFLDEDEEDNDFLDDDESFDSFSSVEAPYEKHKDLFKNLTDFAPFLQKQLAEWIGLTWSDKKGRYIRDKNVEPVMNIKGARWCVNFLRTYARSNNIITQVSEKTYKNIYEDVTRTVYLNVGTRAEEFGIKKDGDIMLICEQIIHSVELVLLGASGIHNYKELLTKTTNRSESVNLNPVNNMQEKRNKSFFSKTSDLFLGR